MTALALALQRLKRRPVSTAFVALMTGATLATAGLIGAGLSALAGLSPELSRAALVVVHLDPELAPERRQALAGEAAALPEVAAAHLLAPEELAARLRETLADTPDLLEGLDPRSLPPVLEVEPAEDAAALGPRLAALEGVEEVHGAELGQAVLGRLAALRTVASSVGWTLLVLLALATATLVAGAAGLQALASREETELMRLFGATEAYVRLPLVFEGVLLGGLGSGLAAAAVVGAVAAARAALGGPLPGVGGLPVELPPPWTWGVFLLAGPLLGAAGAALAAGRGKGAA